MKDFTTYSAEDLLLEESFLNYCRNSNVSDTAFWERTIQENPGMVLTVKQAKQLFHTISITISAAEKAEALKRLQQAIATGENQEQQVRELPLSAAAPTPRRIPWRSLAAAAVTTGIIATLTFLYFRSSAPAAFSMAEYRNTSFDQHIHTTGDQRRKVTLPDGSLAELNYNTVLKVADNFNQHNRWVYLEGEAFFVVQKNTSKPFTVITSRTATTALGTSFKVKSYAGRQPPEENIMLATGKINVQKLTNTATALPIVLHPGEAATQRGDGPLIQSHFALPVIQQWRDQQVVFDRSDLPGVVRIIEFQYGVKVVLINQPRNVIAFTGNFSQKPLQDILEAISFTNKLEYTHTGSVLTIRFR